MSEPITRCAKYFPVPCSSFATFERESHAPRDSWHDSPLLRPRLDTQGSGSSTGKVGKALAGHSVS